MEKKNLNVIRSRNGNEWVGYADDLRRYFIDLAQKELEESMNDETALSCLKDVRRIAELIESWVGLNEDDKNTLMKVTEYNDGWLEWKYIF